MKLRTGEDVECEVCLHVLLVGGGGDTDTFLGHGGGSGYILSEQVSGIMKWSCQRIFANISQSRRMSLLGISPC